MAKASGIDLSAWNGEPDWDKVREAGLDFAFIKVSEGVGYKANYQQQWDGAGKIGLMRGGYHFHRVGAAGAAQADYFMAHARRGELPPVVDFEDAEGLMLTDVTGEQILENLRVCLRRIEDVWHVIPIVYTGYWFLWRCFQESPFYNAIWLAGYALWVAHYTNDPAVEPWRPDWWPWTFYQYTSSGAVAGIDGRVDLNVFHGTREELQVWAGIDAPLVPEKTDKQKLDILWAEYEKWR